MVATLTFTAGWTCCTEVWLLFAPSSTTFLTGGGLRIGIVDFEVTPQTWPHGHITYTNINNNNITYYLQCCSMEEINRRVTEGQESRVMKIMVWADNGYSRRSFTWNGWDITCSGLMIFQEFRYLNSKRAQWLKKGILVHKILLHVGFPWWHDLCTLMAFP
jgi:hypothetical protein